jgi:predicted oxidoreductase
MKTISLGTSSLPVPVIALGCTRINELDLKETELLVNTALDLGINFFDHADIYSNGYCEELFGKALQSAAIPRDRIVIQTKCGIRPGLAYDSSKEHIVKSAEDSLRRLGTDYLDIYMLHRPDALAESEEIASAFEALYQAGKVRYFGVANHNILQIELLKKYLKQPLLADQLQLSLPHAIMITEGLHVNMALDEGNMRSGSVLDYCRLHDITVQCWSPFQYGFLEGPFLGSEKFPRLNAAVDKLAKKYSVSNTTIVMAWLLRHPAKFQVLAGTTKPGRLKDCAKAVDITLSRDEWYELYLSAGHTLP